MFLSKYKWEASFDIKAADYVHKEYKYNLENCICMRCMFPKTAEKSETKENK